MLLPRPDSFVNQAYTVLGWDGPARRAILMLESAALHVRVRLESSSTGCSLARVGAKLVCFVSRADSVMLKSACVHL